MNPSELYTVRAEELIQATERRSRIAEWIAHLARGGAAPAPDDPVWAALVVALDDEDGARAAMREFVAELRDRSAGQAG